MFSVPLESNKWANQKVHLSTNLSYRRFLVTFGSTYVTYFDDLTISNCRLGSRGSCSSGMSYPDGRCGHSPTHRAEASFSFAILQQYPRGVEGRLLCIKPHNKDIFTLRYQSPPPYLCLPTGTTRRFPLVKCLPACITCTLREGRAGAADVSRLAHFVIVMGGPGLNEAGASGEESL